DASGKLTAKKSGDATVTVAVGEVKQDVAVKVALYTTLKVVPPELILKAGEMKPLTAQILDEAGAPIDGKVEWKVENEAVAKVDADGKVAAVAAGKTNVTATAKALTANATVAVESSGPAQFKAAKEAIELKVGKAEKIAVTAADAAGKPVEGVKIEWTTSDAKIATVSPEGECKAVAKGEAVVTAKAGDKTAAVKVTVK
ncbi:MAG: Ig-like domain-containing protein, partial [Deltaproteobacteria bacterium]|nr:Ig-like domain-containing protein [Deltaproteobacteria bacterium]